MNRRTFLTAGTSIAAFLPLAQLRGTGVSQKRSLQELLPPEDLVPDEFEYLGPERGSDTRRVLGRDAGKVLGAFAADEYMLSSGSRLFQGHVTPKVRLALGEEVTSETIDNHHEASLWSAFHGQEPSTEYFTGWCDVELSDCAVDGYRRSEFFFREPQTQQWSNEQAAASKPYREYGVILQSTDWGVLEVEVERNDVNEQWEMRRLAERLMTHMQHTAAVGSPPASPTVQEEGEWP